MCIIQIVLMRIRTFQEKPPDWICLIALKINKFIFRNKDANGGLTNIHQVIEVTLFLYEPKEI